MTRSLLVRPTRLRKTQTIRDMVAQTHLNISDLIAPIFVHETLSEKKAISSMPGVFQLPLSALDEEIEALSHLGINAVLLFGIPAHKDEIGSASFDDNGIVQQAIKQIKAHHPDMLVIADVCFCEYTSHGHCGILNGEHIDNDKTLTYLAKQAVSMARAGVDWVAPSGMIDGMVGVIRQALDEAHFESVTILSYAIKYASHLYGPFREAAEGAPKFGDRKSHQADYRNSAEALLETALDIEEGADIVMVKPALFYLDIIHQIKSTFPSTPLCAYQVSGEYTMLKNAVTAGLLNPNAIMESLIAIKRAGSDMIITYFAKDAALMLKSS